REQRLARGLHVPRLPASIELAAVLIEGGVREALLERETVSALIDRLVRGPSAGASGALASPVAVEELGLGEIEVERGVRERDAEVRFQHGDRAERDARPAGLLVADRRDVVLAVDVAPVERRRRADGGSRDERLVRLRPRADCAIDIVDRERAGRRIHAESLLRFCERELRHARFACYPIVPLLRDAV